jgi:hypothetical protein
MSDLTQIICGPGQIVEAWRESIYVGRAHLGLSDCGHSCERYLWYAHHGYGGEAPDGRVLRLFQLGNLIEDQAYLDLVGAGYVVHSRQREVKVSDGGVTLRGHLDGVIEGLIESSRPHLWECKSASHKRFNELKKVGYEAWDEKYKAQVHVYMILSKLDRCLVWVENKDDSSIYTERIRLDRRYAVKILERCFNAIQRTTPPER